MDLEFSTECSSTGLKRLHRAVRLSRNFGYNGIGFLVPRQLCYTELGYGQGEGQVNIRGIEIGIYMGNSGYLLAIHDLVESRRNESVALVDEFCKWWSRIAKSPVVAVQKSE